MPEGSEEGLARLRLNISNDELLEDRNYGWLKYFDAGSDSLSMGRPTLHWGELSVKGSEPNAAAMAAAMLTVVKGSYRHVQVLRTKEAARKLGLEGDQAEQLPDGFYVLAGDGKIAAAMFPMVPNGSSFGSEPNPSAEAFKALSAPGALLSKHCLPGTFCSDLRFDIDKLFSNPRNFALSLMSKRSNARQSLEDFGFGSSTSMLSDSGAWQYPQLGYPAFVDFGAAPMGELGAAKNYEIQLDKCVGLPIHNHRGYSLINNVRELASASERTAERGKIFDSLMERWLEAHLTRQGLRDEAIISSTSVDDEDGVFWQSKQGVELLKELREKTAEAGRKSSIGSERQLVCNPECTAYFSMAASKMIGSLDFALVDGQHSSVDYAILANAVATQVAGKPKEEWVGFGLGVEESSPESLREKFMQKIPELCKANGLTLQQGSKKAAHLEEMWRDFAEFCGQATTAVRVVEEANPAIQIHKVNEANNRKAQKVEAMAMLKRKEEIADFIDLVNEEAIRRGAREILVQNKSLLSNPNYAGASSDAVVEFEKVFPALYGITRAPDRSKENTRKSNVLIGAGKEGDEEIAEQLSIIFKISKDAERMPDLVVRARVLLDYVGKFKNREFKVAEATMAAFFGPKPTERGLIDHIVAMPTELKDDGRFEGQGGAPYNREANREMAQELSGELREKWGARFDEFVALVKKQVRMLRSDGSSVEIDRSMRARIAYEMFERAMQLTKAIETGAHLNEIVMSADLRESVMLNVSRSIKKTKFGAKDSDAAEEISAAIERVSDLVENNVATRENNFNSAREMLAAQIKIIEEKRKEEEAKKRAKIKEENGRKDDNDQKKEEIQFKLTEIPAQMLAVLLDAMPSGTARESLASAVLEKKADARQTSESAVSEKLARRRTSEPKQNIATKSNAKR